MARVIITHQSMKAERIIELMMEGDPGIVTMKASDTAIFINPMTLEEEIDLVAFKLLKILSLNK